MDGCNKYTFRKKAGETRLIVRQQAKQLKYQACHLKTKQQAVTRPSNPEVPKPEAPFWLVS